MTLSQSMGDVARELKGDPNQALSSANELRFGTRGSLSVNLTKGTFFDHEDGEGGGVVAFVMKEKQIDKASAKAWLAERNHLQPAQAPKQRPKIVTTYAYTDEQGEVLFEVVRYQPKDFRQRRPNGNGSFIWNLEGVRRVLFGLPDVIAAVKAGRTICIVEGEKAAIALKTLNVTATCSPCGAGSWRDEYAATLENADVVVLPDNDEPGRKHAATVVKSLQGIARSVLVLPLPDLPHKGDPFDWIEAGGTRAQLRSLANEASKKPEAPPPKSGDSNKPEQTAERPLVLKPSAPLDSARSFIDREFTRGGLRTAHHQHGAFYTWDAGYYSEINPEEMRARIYQFLDTASRTTAGGEIVRFDPTRAKVANVLEATAAHTQLPTKLRPPTWLDTADHPPAAEIVVCKNGLLHLSKRKLLSHTPAFFTVNALDFAYDANAPKPAAWIQFLNALWPDEPDAISSLQEMFGLLLTGDTRHQKAFLIVGPKRSGKGTIARILTRLLGQANVCGPTLSSLGSNFGIAPLIGKRLAVISDARLGAKTDQQVIVERVLAITGEDSLTIDRKFLEAWTGKLETRFLVLSNELPRLADASGALPSRFIIWMLKNSFFGKEDLGLTERLTAELPGILNWALDGWDRLQQRGYFVPQESAKEAQQEMEDLGSPVGAFLRERCVVGVGSQVECNLLFNAWVAWCRDNNREHPGTVQGFGRDLRSIVPGLTIGRLQTGNTSTGNTTRPRHYEGLRLENPR